MFRIQIRKKKHSYN